MGDQIKRPPSTLDELLELIPGMARRRLINADMLRSLLSREAKQCTWCGKDVGKRRTWCSDECVTEFNLRCSPQHQRDFVLKRDKGICQECGLDTIKAEQDFRVEWAKHCLGVAYSWRYREEYKKKFGFCRGQWREVDHILPVVLGGGLCSVDNLRLLCGSCHAKATKKLAGRKKSGVRK